MDKKRVVSFILSLLMLLGTFANPVFAISSNSSKGEEANFEIQEIDGKTYKVYKVSDLGLKNPEKLLTPKYRTRAAGDPMEDWVKLKLNSTTVGLTLGKDFNVEVYVALRKDDTKIAVAKINPTEEWIEGQIFHFVKTEAYDENNPDHQDPDKWYLYVENDFQYDIRLKYGESGNFGSETMTMTINQRAVPLYKAVWFTNNQQRPVVDAFYNDGDNIANPVKLNTTDFAENEYKSFSSEKMPFYVGQKEVIVKEENLGTVDKEKFLVSDKKGAALWKLLIDQNGEKKTQGFVKDGDTKYHFNITGDYKTPFVATMREELKVKFDPNGATFDPAVKTEQAIGHSMKIGEAFGDLEAVKVPTKDQISNIPQKDNKDQEFVGWVVDEENKDLDFSEGKNADKLVNPNGYEVKKNETFYAVYAPVAQGKVNVKYQDMDGNPIDAKYKFISDKAGEDEVKVVKEGTETTRKLTLDEKYPTEKEGNKGKPITDEHLNGAPVFLGYEFKKVETKPVPEPPATANYADPAKYTLIYKYNKLDSVIPEKDPNGGDDNTKPDGYVTVTFHADKDENTGDKQRGKLYKTDENVVEDKIVYFVNPADGIMLSNDKLVAKVKPNKGYKNAEGLQFQDKAESLDSLDVIITTDSDLYAQYVEKDKVVKLDDPENPTNFPKDPKDNSKNDADYVTVKFVADANGKIKEGESEKTKGIAYAVLKNTEWADAVKAGIVVPEENAEGNAPKLVGKDKFHSFNEWQKDGNKVTEFAKVDADVTYTAVFGKADELTVTYKLNAPKDLTVGGKAPTDDTKYLKDEEVTVKALEADNKIAGYQFTGWNTQADGKGTAYEAGAKFAIKANTELFAQWEKTAKDVIPVDNENDKKGKDGEEIPDNYVFVEFKVKDTDADKAEIKADQQAKFKVDPKAKVTLTAPELEVKKAYKVSHTASFNKDDYTDKKFEQATTIWASVSEKGKITVKYVFKTNPNTKALPKVLDDLKPTDLEGNTAVYPENAPSKPDAPATTSFDVVEDGKKVGTWEAGSWSEAVKDDKGNITYTLTWTFEEVGKSKTPDVNPIKPGDKEIKGKGKAGSDIEVKLPDGKKVPGKVDQNGDWTVKVPEDKKLKDGDKVIVTQTEKDKKPSDPVEKTVTADKKPEPRPSAPAITWRGLWFLGDSKSEPVQEMETGRHYKYLYGYVDKTVRPEGMITRSEAAALIARLANLDMTDKTKPNFKDTPSAWYNGAINAMVSKNLMFADKDGNFRPNQPITRGEFARALYYIDKKNDKVAPFADVKGHEFEDAINQAYGNGRIAGYQDGTFKPNANIQRAEAARILNQFADRNVTLAGMANVKNDLVRFTDINESHWAYCEVMEAANSHEYQRAKGTLAETWLKILDK
ncbi:S-layer homology domain-containing protein [Urinicoccus massiliensis]|uniref:S-layer homology domain-containing protein n=1 Tax=Urinicoccus massiliensis TaxID=1723382 RepID=UPI0009F92E1B|nr:S-layer homology domain-containing protein [Urinicoccus massiliensis]